MAVELTSRLDNEVKVLYAVEGRVRLRLLGSDTRSVLDTIAQQLQQQDGIYQVSINEQTGSLLITFEPNQLSLVQLFEQLEQLGIPQVQGLSPQATSWSDAYTRARTQLKSLIPPIAGILTAKGLRIYGWQAISAYLIVSGITREVIKQLELELPELPKSNSQETAVQSNGKLATVAVTDNDLMPASKAACSIVHGIPGRVRFHIPRIAQDRDYAKELQSLKTIDARIIGVRVNQTTCSVVVTYQPDTCSEVERDSNNGRMPLNSSYLLNLIQSVGNPDNSEMVQELSPLLSIEDELINSEQLSVSSDQVLEEDFSLAHTSPQDEETSAFPEEQELGRASQGCTNDSSRSILLPRTTGSEQDTHTTNLPKGDASESANQVSAEETLVLEETELSNQVSAENTSPWSRFKACVLAMMLKLIANLPVAPAEVNTSVLETGQGR